ncbi:WD40 repeat-like protein [Peniophora sp. CONT]|nr:WD40 repeat-like protein [Peniophora sp. CONT]
MASTSNGTGPSLPVVFTTQTPYPLPAQKFFIPAAWKRYQLSQLVNKALGLPRVVPFDFIVGGEILRGSLAEWTAEKGLGEEETIQIEYIESVMPPQRMAALPHEDWVSSISCQLPGHFLTGSYDGNVRLFSYSQSLLHTAPIHAAPITSVSLVPQPTASPSESNSTLLVTGSHDLTARLTRITPASEDAADNGETQVLASLHLHTAPVSSVSADSTGAHILTASWDGMLGLWDTIIPEKDETPADPQPARQKKRRRLAGAEDAPRRKAPLGVMRSHTARVSAALFAGDGQAVSAGFDSTVRVWDIERQLCTHTVSASEKPFLALALPGGTGQTALAGAADRSVTLFDLRADATQIASATFSHAAAPAALAVSPSAGSQQFVSGGYDGVVRLWDARSATKEMASFKVWEGKEGRKVLGVDWNGDVVGIAGEGGVEVWNVVESRS